MPQITLQHSDELAINMNYEEFFSTIHNLLSDTADIDISNCKSRVIKVDNIYIGDGDPDQRFVHLEVKLLEGRSKQLKDRIGKKLLNELKQVFVDSGDRGSVQITVEIIDINRDNYFKFSDT